MEWIVIGEEKGYIKLVSKSGTSGLLPKGSYLTIERKDNKYILRVDETYQNEAYTPTPLVVDMDLSPLKQDQKCQNIVYARRIRDLKEREDGLIDFILSQSIARRSNQTEVELALGSNNAKKGPEVILSTIHSSRSQILTDDNSKAITVKLPQEMYYHQILICGKTGSGKTVASKYLADHFVKKMGGAVLAINVKDVDFLMMDKPSKTSNQEVIKEWELLNIKPSGIDNFIVYFPANISYETAPGVNKAKCRSITMNVKEIDPDAISGLIRGISDVGAQNLPNIFRYWQENSKRNNEELTFNKFIDYFANAEADGRRFRTMNSRGDETTEITLHSGTYNNVLRNLVNASEFFDNKDATTLDYDDILYPGKMSVINVAGKNGVDFGSVLLRHLLHRIVEIKSQKKSIVPILIIIDEVHQFYNTESSKEALGDIDTICRTGRSQEIGVIFSSQNPSDIPSGLNSVINTKIFFKTDMSSPKAQGLNFSNEEIGNLRTGFAAVSIHDLSQVKSVKFPLSPCGVFEKEELE